MRLTLASFGADEVWWVWLRWMGSCPRARGRGKRRAADGRIRTERERAYRLRDLGIEMFSWVLAMGAMSLCRPFSPVCLAFLHAQRRRHTHLSANMGPSRGRMRKKKKTDLTANVPPLAHRATNQTGVVQAVHHAFRLTHTLSLRLTPWDFSCRIRQLACAPTKAEGKADEYSSCTRDQQRPTRKIIRIVCTSTSYKLDAHIQLVVYSVHVLRTYTHIPITSASSCALSCGRQGGSAHAWHVWVCTHSTSE